MEGHKTWILIADASQAKIYSVHKAKLFKEQDKYTELDAIGEFVHAASRKKTGELVTDKQGGFGTGTFVNASSAKDHEAEQFAHKLLAHLEAGRKSHAFVDIVLIAPPAFMGLLNTFMTAETQKFVSKKIEKDYTQDSEKELLQNLLNHL